MKHLLLLPFIGMGLIPASYNPATNLSRIKTSELNIIDSVKGLLISSQAEPGSQRMAAAVFKAQEFCRVELKDFDFDAHFIVKSATVYFSETNFPQIVKGTINSTSLKPISSLMKKCAPGSIIMFDDVRVIGPDNLPRVIAGITITLF